MGKNKFLRYDVTKLRHNVKILVDMESAHRGLSYEVLLNMVPSFSKFDLGVFSTRSENHEDQGRSAPKINLDLIIK
jgi:hypothetical protein